MPKIHDLLGVKLKLTSSRRPYLRELVHPHQPPLPLAKQQEYTYRVGCYTVLLEEVADHLHALQEVAAACAHGLAGTQPDDYDEWAYGENEQPQPYDPYQVIDEALSTELPAPACLTLSPALLRYIETIPAGEHASVTYFNEHYGQPLFGDGVQAQLRGLEQTFFVSTYNEEIAQLHVLARQRGSLLQIQRIL